MNIALIMMGGSGTRFGAKIPKQFVEVDGRPVFTYLLEAYENFDEIDGIYVVCHSEWVGFTESCAKDHQISKLKAIVPGGANRSQSVQYGLDAIAHEAERDDVVLIHDVTHPFVDKDNVLKCVDYARDEGAATLVGACFDTMYQIDENDHIAHVVPREKIVSATAPECFRFEKVYPMYKGKAVDELEQMTSAGAMMLANGQSVRIVKTPLINLKITLHEDMEAFKKLLHGYYY